HTNTALEVLLPGTTYGTVVVFTNAAVAGGNAYRTSTNTLNGQAVVKVWVGKSVTNAVISYSPVVLSGSLFTENFDGVASPGLPPGWTTVASGIESPWVTSITTSDTAPNSAYVPDPANLGTSDLVSPVIVMPSGQSRLSFRNNYSLECDPTHAT